MWIHDFKNLMAHKKLWHAMTNIGAINSRHTKIYGVTKNHGLPWKFVINHKGQQYFQLANKWN
jgi:hypothetical protein